MSTAIPIAPQLIAPDPIHAQNIRVAFNLFRLVRLLRTNKPLTGKIFAFLQSFVIWSALMLIAFLEFNSHPVQAILLLIFAAVIILCAIGIFVSPTFQDALDLENQENKQRDNYRKLVKAVYLGVIENARQNLQLSILGREPVDIQQTCKLTLQRAQATFEHKCAEAHKWTLERVQNEV